MTSITAGKTTLAGSSSVLHSNLKNAPPRIVSGKGNYFTVENGQRIFDASGGPAVTCIGHGNERVAEAVTKQMTEISYCHGLYWSNSAAEDLAEILVNSTNGDMARASMVSSGMLALIMSIHTVEHHTH